MIAKKRLVEIYFIKNDSQTAKQYIDEILKANANDNDGLFFRGRLYLAENEPKKAAEDLSTVTRNAPKFAPGLLFSRASADYGKTKSIEAKKTITKASELAPNWIEPKIALAQLYLAAGDIRLASRRDRKVLEGSTQ